MRVFLTAVALVAGLSIATEGAVAAPVTAGTGPCPPKKGKRVEILQRTKQAVVFTRRGRTVACWRASGKVWSLGRGAPVSELRGDRLAYGFGATLRVLRLPTGDAVDVGMAVETGAPLSGAKVTDVVLRGDGAMAWIGEAKSGGALVRQVRQVGGLLGTGPTIEPASLELRGERVAWEQSGVERSAPLTLPEPVTPGAPIDQRAT